MGLSGGGEARDVTTDPILISPTRAPDSSFVDACFEISEETMMMGDSDLTVEDWKRREGERLESTVLRGGEDGRVEGRMGWHTPRFMELERDDADDELRTAPFEWVTLEEEVDPASVVVAVVDVVSSDCDDDSG